MVLRARPDTAALTAITGVAVTALVLVPLARLGWTVLVEDHASLARVVSAPGFGRALAHSLELAVAVPMLAVPIGTAAALLLRRPGLPGRRSLQALTVLPLVVPQFVLGYSWTQAYAPAGFTDELIGVRWSGLTGAGGVLAVLVVDAVPLSYLLVTAGLATRAQPQLEAAAHAAGASEWTVLRTIVLPLLRPVLAAAAVLTFVLSLESFAAPQVLGTPAGYQTLTTRLYADLVLAGDPAAFVDAVTLAFGLLLIALVLLLPADLLLGPRLRASRSAQPGRAAVRPRPGLPARVSALLLVGYALLAVVLPTVALLAASVTRAVGLAPTPSNWTLNNYRVALSGPTLVSLRNSIELALVAAVVLVSLGAALAVLERHRGGRVLASLSAGAFAVPGSALAVGVLIAYDRRLGGTLAIILIAYLAKFWALAHRTVSGAMDRVPPGEWQAARTSGAGIAAAVRTVWLPGMAPALIAAAVLVFVASLHEVTMSSLLYSSGSETFAVTVLNSQQLGQVTTTAAQSVTLTAVIVVFVLAGAALLRAVRPVSARSTRGLRLPRSVHAG